MHEDIHHILMGPYECMCSVTETWPMLFFLIYMTNLHMGSTNYYNNICYMGLTNEHNNISLFSTITYPGRPNKHCWTIGYLEGNLYVFRSKSADIDNPRRTEVFTTTFPLPLSCKSFIIPYPSPSLYLATSYSTPIIPTEPGQYGSRTIPLPNDDCIGHPLSGSSNLHPTTINSTCELSAPHSTVPLQGAQLSVQPDPPNKQGHQGGQEEVPSSPQSYGATGTCFWSTLSLDGGLDGGN